MDSVDGRLAQPALTTQFTSDCGSARGHGLAERLTEVIIAADTFFVKTIQAEHGLRMIGIDRVFDLAVSTQTLRAEVSEFHRQGRQVTKLLGKAGGLFGALAFLLPVIVARCEFSVIHKIDSESEDRIFTLRSFGRWTREMV